MLGLTATATASIGLLGAIDAADGTLLGIWVSVGVIADAARDSKPAASTRRRDSRWTRSPERTGVATRNSSSCAGRRRAVGLQRSGRDQLRGTAGDPVIAAFAALAAWRSGPYEASWPWHFHRPGAKPRFSVGFADDACAWRAWCLSPERPSRHRLKRQMTGHLSIGGLIVGGDLDLRGTQMSVLPDDLTVDGRLNLLGTQFSVLPDVSRRPTHVRGWATCIHAECCFRFGVRGCQREPGPANLSDHGVAHRSLRMRRCAPAVRHDDCTTPWCGTGIDATVPL